MGTAWGSWARQRNNVLFSKAEVLPGKQNFAGPGALEARAGEDHERAELRPLEAAAETSRALAYPLFHRSPLVGAPLYDRVATKSPFVQYRRQLRW